MSAPTSEARGIPGSGPLVCSPSRPERQISGPRTSARGAIAVHMPWRRRKPPVQRILITPGNPAEEIHMLSGLVRNLNETVQSLWDTVHDLRLELGAVRPAAC